MLMRRLQNMPEWPFEGRPRQGKNMYSDRLDWLSYLSFFLRKLKNTKIQ
jgi:hypothetical protein